LTRDIIKVTLRLPPSTNFDFMPGQYIEVIGPDGERRSYSIANSPRTDQKLELHIKAVKCGVMSRYWFNRAGAEDLLRLRGPLGTFFMRDIRRRDLFFLATGTGMAPVKAMLESLGALSPDQMAQSVTVIWGGRYIQDLYLDVSGLPGTYSYIPVLTREALWQGESAYIQDVLLRQKSDLRNCSVYACGSDAMIYSARASLTAAGLPSQHFYSDAFVPSGAHFA
jgi:CDP-4-dehydro-6-deoxyglucose reductase